jgi:hypothetical protein
MRPSPSSERLQAHSQLPHSQPAHSHSAHWQPAAAPVPHWQLAHWQSAHLQVAQPQSETWVAEAAAWVLVEEDVISGLQESGW